MKHAKLLLPLILLGLLIGSSSCKKNRDAKGIVTVLKDSVNFITGDTVQVPVVLASVRFYSEQIGSKIDTIILSGTDGKSTFVWFEDVIIKYDVTTSLGNADLDNYIILKQGETEEKTVTFPL